MHGLCESNCKRGPFLLISFQRNFLKRRGNLLKNFYNSLFLPLSASVRATTGKRKRADVKQYLADYGHDKGTKNVKKLLLEGTWEPSPYKIKTIQDKGKTRELQIAPFYPDRIVHHVINSILTDVYVPMFINDTYQCLAGRGPARAIKKVEGYVQGNISEYVLKVDIKKFYPTVDNEILKQKLRKKIKDKDFLNLVDKLIDSTKGIPLGNVTSQILGNIYLNDLDHIMKNLNSTYIRYADDILVFGTKQQCKEYLEVIKDYLTQHNLTLNPATQYFPLDKRTLVFLGFRFYRTHTRPKKAMIYKILKQHHSMNKEQKASTFGWLKNSDSSLITICKLYQDQLEVEDKNRAHVRQYKAFYKYLHFKRNKEKHNEVITSQVK